PLALLPAAGADHARLASEGAAAHGGLGVGIRRQGGSAAGEGRIPSVDAAELRARCALRAGGRRELEPVLRGLTRLRLAQPLEQPADEHGRRAPGPRIPRSYHARLQRDERARLLPPLARATDGGWQR